MNRVGRALIGALLIVAFSLSPALAVSKARTAKARLVLGKGKSKAYRAKVQDMVYGALKKQARGDASLRAMLQDAKPADIRFRTKRAAAGRYSKGRALVGSKLSLRQLSFSLSTARGAIEGKSDLIVDNAGEVHQKSLGANWYNDRLSYRLP